jgi:hypothetical protein
MRTSTLIKGLTVGVVVWTAAISNADVVVHEPGYTAEWVTTFSNGALALDFGNGGVFGTDLYVSAGEGGGGQNYVHRVDTSTGSIVQSASYAAGGNVADGLSFPTTASSAFPAGLYIGWNHYHPVLHLASPGGTPTPFSPHDGWAHSPLEFDPSGAYGGDLYLGGSFGVRRIAPDGSRTPFETSVEAESIGFGQGGAFGDFMYIGDDDAGIWRVDSSGTPTKIAQLPGVHGVQGMVVDTVGHFGGDMFVNLADNSTIYRVRPDATFSEFATCDIGTGSDGLAFGPDGYLYVGHGTDVYRIVPEPTTFAVLALVSLGVLGRKW